MISGRRQLIDRLELTLPHYGYALFSIPLVLHHYVPDTVQLLTVTGNYSTQLLTVVSSKQGTFGTEYIDYIRLGIFKLNNDIITTFGFVLQRVNLSLDSNSTPSSLSSSSLFDVD